MASPAEDSRLPRLAGLTDGKNYTRTEQEVIDEDLHVTIYKSAASSNWYAQYNHPTEGQRKQSLRTRNRKKAQRKAWEIVLKLRGGDIEPRQSGVHGSEKAVESFLADKRRIGRRGTTLTEYRRALEQFCKFAAEQGITRLDQLTPTDMEKFELPFRETGIALKREQRTPGRPAKKTNPRRSTRRSSSSRA